MSDLPALRSPDARTRRLVVTKRRATALLGVVAVVWLVATIARWPYVQATAEASLVGGLADWFAVTALFRRPLGLPIPHTAIIVARKDQFGATLGEFIGESFLTPDAIVARVRGTGAVTRLATWAADPAHARQLADDTLGFASLETVDLAALGARALRAATADGRHQRAIDAGLRALDSYLAAHGDELRARLGTTSPWWLPRAAEDRIFERLLDGARAVITDMIGGHPAHPMRRDLDAAIERFIDELATSPEWKARGEDLKRELDLNGQLATAVSSFASRVLDDPSLHERVSAGLERVAVEVTSRFAGEIVDLVGATIERWDAAETSRRLELLLGPDLQYIRINGTVVGGLAGLVLFTAARMLHSG